MLVALPSFYFPLRKSDGYPISQSLLTTSDGQEYSLSSVSIFFFLQIFGGHFGVPLILVTLYVAKGVRRHPMLINFLVSWIVYSTSFCVLLYLGKQFGPEPDHRVCALQASLIYGTAIMTPTAGLSFVINLWCTIRDLAENKSNGKYHSLRNYLLISAPYGVFLAFVIFRGFCGFFMRTMCPDSDKFVFKYAAVNPVLLSRNRYLFYCTINSAVVDVVPAMAAVIMFAVVVFEGKTHDSQYETRIILITHRKCFTGLIAVKLYRMHKGFLSMRTTGGPPLHLIVRVGIFSTYSFLSIVACIGFWSKQGEELPYVIQASLPTAAFIIFGSQRDILEAWGVIRLWHFLRRKPAVMNQIVQLKPLSRT